MNTPRRNVQRSTAADVTRELAPGVLEGFWREYQASRAKFIRVGDLVLTSPVNPDDSRISNLVHHKGLAEVATARTQHMGASGLGYKTLVEKATGRQTGFHDAGYLEITINQDKASPEYGTLTDVTVCLGSLEFGLGDERNRKVTIEAVDSALKIAPAYAA